MKSGHMHALFNVAENVAAYVKCHYLIENGQISKRQTQVKRMKGTNSK